MTFWICFSNKHNPYRFDIQSVRDGWRDVHLSANSAQEQTGSFREEFRAPAGVRKSPRKEPAGHRRGYGDFGFRLMSGMERPPLGSAGIDADGPPRLPVARYCRLGARPAALPTSMITMDAHGCVAGGRVPVADGWTVACRVMGRLPARCRRVGGPRLPPPFEHLDDDHASAAARAWRAEVVWFGRWIIYGVRRGREQAAGEREAGLAGATGEQAVVPDAMEATRQDMEQEAADELVGGERHDLLPVGAVATVVLVAECDATLVEADEAAV